MAAKIEKKPVPSNPALLKLAKPPLQSVTTKKLLRRVISVLSNTQKSNRRELRRAKKEKSLSIGSTQRAYNKKRKTIDLTSKSGRLELTMMLQELNKSR